MQAPFHGGPETQVLVDVRGDEDVYLEPPQYHAENTLVYRIYGYDLLARLGAIGFSCGLVQALSRRHAISAQVMFVFRKGAPLPIVADWPAQVVGLTQSLT